MEDIGILVVVVFCAAALFIMGMATGAKIEQHDTGKAACVETCAPQAALFSDGKCGCVR